MKYECNQSSCEIIFEVSSTLFKQRNLCGSMRKKHHFSFRLRFLASLARWESITKRSDDLVNSVGLDLQ